VIYQTVPKLTIHYRVTVHALIGFVFVCCAALRCAPGVSHKGGELGEEVSPMEATLGTRAAASSALTCGATVSTKHQQRAYIARLG